MNLLDLSSRTVRYAAVEKKKKIQCLSAGVSFLFWCVATVVIHHSGVVLCHSNPEVVKCLLLLLRCSSLRMCCYQARSAQMSIKISVRWRRDITGALFGRGKGHVIATYSVIRRAECHYIIWVTTKIKNTFFFPLWPQVSAGVFPVWKRLSLSLLYLSVRLLKASNPSWPGCDSAHLRAVQALGR